MNEASGSTNRYEPPGPDLSLAASALARELHHQIDDRFSSDRRKFRLFHWMLVIAVEAVLLWLAVLFGVLAVLALIGLNLGFAVVLITVLARIGAARQDTLLGVLAIAAEKNLALAPAASAFSAQGIGRTRRRFLRLVDELHAGNTLTGALEAAPRLIAQDGVLLIRAGEDSGQLPQALAIAAKYRASRLPLWLAIAGRFSYILLLLVALQTIMSFILYFIVPKFEAIFGDFGVSLPQATILVIDLSHSIVRYSPLALLIVGLEIFLVLTLPASLAGWNQFQIPLFDRLLIRRHSALVARCLSLYVAAAQPVTRALGLLSQYYPTRWFRTRIKRANSEILQGQDWLAALERHEIIRPADAEVLRSAQAVGNLEWALEEHAERNERRLAYRLQVVFVTLFPLVVLTIGFVVFVVALGFFAPLVKLISELSA